MNFLCIEFVNSNWYITHKRFEDPLLDKAWLLKLAEKWGIRPLPDPEEEDVARLIAMRNCFAKLLSKAAEGVKPDNADIELINSYMAGVCFYRKLKTEGNTCKLHDIPKVRNWSWFMAEAAASLSSLYTSEALKSLKICGNPECGWFFIDESKSKNRKWCDDTCASLMKVRRFRERQRKDKQNAR